MTTAARSTNTVVGSNHIRYVGGPNVLRLTTDAPLSYITSEVAFPLTRPINLDFRSGRPVPAAGSTRPRANFSTARATIGSTGCAISRVPFEWQAEVDPRGDHAEALQLQGDRRDRRRPHDLDSRGAATRRATGIIGTAGCVTPYFVVDALNRLGATQTMESYIHYITTIATDVDDHEAGARHRAVHAAGGMIAERPEGI